MAADDPHSWRPLLPDEATPGATAPKQTFYEEGPNAGKPAADSTKVGWTLRNRSGRILQAVAFAINPQGLTRTQGTRSQLFATKGGFYVDDFGPGAAVIQMRQLVASGKTFPGGFYTAREDVQRWLQQIYLPATQADRGATRVFFHDHHFERGMEEEIYFPDQALTLERSVELHTVWRVDVQMVSLQANALGQATAQKSPNLATTRKYIVRRGDTMEKIVRRLAGAKASATKVSQARDLLLALNPQLAHSRPVPGRTGKAMRVYPGEILRLPA